MLLVGARKLPEKMAPKLHRQREDKARASPEMPSSYRVGQEFRQIIPVWHNTVYLRMVSLKAKLLRTLNLVGAQ